MLGSFLYSSVSWVLYTSVSWISVLIFGTLMLVFLLQLKQKQSQLAQVNSSVENSHLPLYRTSLKGEVLYCNPALAKLTQFDSGPEMLGSISDPATEWYVDPNRREQLFAVLEKDGKVTDFISEVHVGRGGETIWVSETVEVIRDSKDGTPLYYQGSVSDVTDRVQREHADNLVKNLVDNLPAPLFQLTRRPDGSMYMPYTNKAMERIRTEKYKHSPELSMQELAENLLDINSEEIAASFEHSAVNGVPFNFECRTIDEDNQEYWHRVSAQPEVKVDGSVTWYGHMLNITDIVAHQQKIERLAFFDSLTGLPNREHFETLVMDVLEKDRDCEEFSHFALCFVDVDNFKLINDAHGHGAGDMLLQATAERLKSSLRKRDLVCRFGGDEFVIFLNGLGSDKNVASEQIQDLTDTVLAEMRREFNLDKMTFSTTMSMGVAFFENAQRIDFGEVLKSADVAMYEAKRSGRNHVVIYDADIQKDVSVSYALQGELKAAMDENQFVLELQPQMHRDGSLKSAEVLLRWNHPERGRIMPNQFIPLAEQTGMIKSINCWVIRESIKLVASWNKDPRLSEISLSINVSPQQMRDVGFKDRLCANLSKYNVDPSKVIIELTEHVMAKDPERIATSMEFLRDKGIRFSLDDFGTGYSSLSQLKQFPFDELKIDGSFISELAHEKDVQSLVAAIMGMAKALDMQTVAEHVTEFSQVELLTELGCDLFQGYLFSRPLPVKDFETYARANLTGTDDGLLKTGT